MRYEKYEIPTKNGSKVVAYRVEHEDFAVPIWLIGRSHFDDRYVVEFVFPSRKMGLCDALREAFNSYREVVDNVYLFAWIEKCYQK